MADELIFRIEVTGTQESLEKVARLKGESMLLAKEQSEVNRQFSQGKMSLDQYSRATAELDARKKTLKNDLDQENASIKRQQQEYKAAEGSMTAISNKLSELRIKYRELSKAERENADIGGAMLGKIQSLDKEIKTLDASVGNHQRNVGNYPNVMGAFGNSIMHTIPGLGNLQGMIGTVDGSMNTMTSSAGATTAGVAALGAGIGVAALAFGGIITVMKDVVANSDYLSDKWEEATKEMEFAYSAFLTTIANGDFSNLTENMERAIALGREYAQMMDEVENRTRAISIIASESELKVDQLRVQLRNKNLGDEERKRIAAEIVRLEKVIMEEKQKTSKIDLEAQLKKIQAQTNLSAPEVKRYLKGAVDEPALLKEAERYLYLVENMTVTTIDDHGRAVQVINREMQEEVKTISNAAMQYSRVIKAMKNANVEDLEEVKRAWVDLNRVQHEFNQNTAKALQAENNLEYKGNKEETRDAGKAEREAEKREREEERLKAAQEKKWEEEGRLWEEKMKEQVELERKAEDLKLKLGTATQDELLRIAMDRVTKSKEFALLSAEEQARVTKVIYQEALKISAKGISDLEEVDPEFTGNRTLTSQHAADAQKQVKNRNLNTNWVGNAVDKGIGDALSGIGVSGTDEQMQSYIGAVKSQIGNLVSDVTNMWLDGQSQRIQKELKAETAKVDAQAKSELKTLEMKRKKNLITEKQYNEEREKIEEQTAKKKDQLNREAFEKDKKVKMLSAIMAGALAVVQMLANPGGIIGIVLAALAALTAGIQIAKIAGTKYEGARGGLLHGKSHDEGGIKYQWGGDIVELEGGEGVINKRSMSSGDVLTLTGTPRQIASDINSYKGYGIRFDAGGYTPASTPLSSGVRISRGSVDNLVDERLQALKVYVVESEMTEVQGRVKKIDVEATW